MTQPRLLILGGRSDIGLAIAHYFAAHKGYAVQLAARNVDTLKEAQKDIETQHNVSVSLHEFDALDIDQHQAFAARFDPLPDILVCVVGALGDQTKSEQDFALATKIMRSNYEGPALAMAAFANRFAKRQSGQLIGVSSVAGERGRISNYVYGSAKAGFSAFLSGLRARMSRHGVHVMTVLPGFVATQMTAHLDLPRRLTASPEQVAKAVFKAARTKRDIIYVKPIWRLIMRVVRLVPERRFKKMNF